MNELNRLEDLRVKVKDLARNEENFKKIEGIRMNEYLREGGDNVLHKMGSYGFNLRETGDIPVKEFKRVLKIRFSKSAREFDYYVKSFLNDIEDEIWRIKRQIWLDELKLYDEQA